MTEGEYIHSRLIGKPHSQKEWGFILKKIFLYQSIVYICLNNTKMSNDHISFRVSDRETVKVYPLSMQVSSFRTDSLGFEKLVTSKTYMDKKEFEKRVKSIEKKYERK